MDFWDVNGQPVAYIADDGESIYLWDGRPVARISGDGIYGYDGHFRGWFRDGWVRDRDGACVFSTEEANGGPMKPVRQVRPVRGIKQIRPVRGVREVRPIRPVNQLAWSELSCEAFFGFIAEEQEST